MGVKLGFLHLAKKHRCRVFERRVLRIILKTNRPEVTGAGDDDDDDNSVLCSPMIKNTLCTLNRYN